MSDSYSRVAVYTVHDGICVCLQCSCICICQTGLAHKQIAALSIIINVQRYLIKIDHASAN